MLETDSAFIIEPAETHDAYMPIDPPVPTDALVPIYSLRTSGIATS